MAAKEIYSVFSLGNVLKSVSDDFHGYSRCYLSDAWIHFLNNKNRNQVMSRWMFLKAPPEVCYFLWFQAPWQCKGGPQGA